VDDEILEEETDEERVQMTAQDIKFLRSLKISVDNLEE
jgi:hypothetical protein